LTSQESFFFPQGTGSSRLRAAHRPCVGGVGALNRSYCWKHKVDPGKPLSLETASSAIDELIHKGDK
jgi:hypothetical protein